MTVDAARQLIELARQLLLQADAKLDSAAPPASDPAPAPAPVPAPAPAPAPVPPPPHPDVAGKYLCTHPRVFQPILQGEIPGRLGQPVGWQIYEGPSSDSVCDGSAWRWDNLGGDYIDADGVPQGTRPWSTLLLDDAPIGGAATYDVDVTQALREAIARGQPATLLLRCGAPRLAAGMHTDSPPLLLLRRGGDTWSLPVLFSGSLSSATPDRADPAARFPLAVELPVPDGDWDTAALHLTVTTQMRSGDPRATVWLLTPDRSLPPVEPDPPRTDAIAVHAFEDGRPASDYFWPAKPPHLRWQDNYESPSNWDPAVLGEGPRDITRFPHRATGKWLGADASPNVDIVPSDQIPFGPAVPGLGALRVTFPRDPQAVEGGYAPVAGLLGCRLDMPLPEEDCGRLRTLFIRFRHAWSVLPGFRHRVMPADQIMVYRGANHTDPRWGSIGGKWGVVPTHDNAFGFSGTSGGGGGWQTRLLWNYPLVGMDGPLADRMRIGWHMDDFRASHALPGYAYAGMRGPHTWGRVGGALLPDTWYDIEIEVTLNTLSDVGRIAERDDRGRLTGRTVEHVVNGVPQLWAADGEMRAWVDGMLAREDTGLAIRSLPLIKRPPGSIKLYGIRELGHKGVMLNEYAGGSTPFPHSRIAWYSDIVVSRTRIGRGRVVQPSA